MLKPPRKRLYNVELVFPNQTTRTVKVKAATQEVAEHRALKRNPAALRVKEKS